MEISSPADADEFWNLCEHNVFSLQSLVNGGNLLNERQCVDLSSKLSKTTQNIRELMLHCGASIALFRPALENLFRYLEKAKLLLTMCKQEDWCAASVFQIQNENAFREILLDVGLCYKAIYEQARSTSEEQTLPQDLRQSSVFIPAPESDVHEDQVKLQKRLEALAGEHGLALKQCLARYLLVKLNHTSDISQGDALDTCSAILWAKEIEPPGTWGSHSYFLGSGSGASGVCSTEWMGIPCAKKVFHLEEDESFLLKEAAILAHLKHPCIVNFFCCGNGEENGDRFIAMELMESSLSHLINKQSKLIKKQGVHFSLPVVVDILVQIARGMCYLHEQGVAHRDLKPQNVVVNRLRSPHLVDHFDVKLVDFGMSKTKVQVSKSNTISAPGVGTTNYRAPEVHPKAHLDGRGKVDWFKVDVFSFGMTCAHVLNLKKPLEDIELSELYDDLMKGRRPKLPIDCPKELDALLRDCWNTSPPLRPSFREICTRLQALRYQILRGTPLKAVDNHQAYPSSNISSFGGGNCSLQLLGSHLVANFPKPQSSSQIGIVTTLRNNTNSVVVLREGQVGVLRKVCEIPARGSQQVRTNLTATYKVYWCAVQLTSDKFILSSDDCIEWKEIEIRRKESDPTKFEWKGTVAANPEGNPPPSPPTPSLLMSTGTVLSKKEPGWFPKPKIPGFRCLTATPADGL